MTTCNMGKRFLANDMITRDGIERRQLLVFSMINLNARSVAKEINELENVRLSQKKQEKTRACILENNADEEVFPSSYTVLRKYGETRRGLYW